MAYWLPVSLLAALAGLMAAKKKVLKRPSTHTRLKALEAEAAKKKPKRKTKAKRDEHGRFVKEDIADLTTPSF